MLFLARSLNVGGAERQLCVLARELKARGCDVSIVVFYGDGVMEAQVRESGIRVIDLAKKGRWNIVSFGVRLHRTFQRERPDIVYSFLCVPNILAALSKPLLPRTKFVWGVRASGMDSTKYDWTFKILWRIECALSPFADLVICNSNAGREHAAKHGFPHESMVVINNGIDTVCFRPDDNARRSVRAQWRISDDEILIGLVARLDPMKGHRTFLEAAAMVGGERRDVRFVCVGDGPDAYKRELVARAQRLGLERSVVWPGARDDMPAVNAALDIACSSSSFGEGFSNAVAEAMASEVPCVVTDVGDSSAVVGDTGPVVPPEDAMALKVAMLDLIDRVRRDATLRKRCRDRIVDHFGPHALAEATLFQFKRLVSSSPQSAAVGNEAR